MKVDSWFLSSFQNGSSVTYMRKYANCLKDQYRILDFLCNCFNHLSVHMTNTSLPQKATKKKKQTSHQKQEIKILNPGSKDYPLLPRVE